MKNKTKQNKINSKCLVIYIKNNPQPSNTTDTSKKLKTKMRKQKNY